MRNSDVNKLLEELRKLVLTEEGLKQVTEVLLNWIMQKEIGNLDLSVPRDRNGLFRPAILPEHWKRADGAFQDLELFSIEA
ncbi:MAG: transposase [Deltaproteobacteria bacterium]|nr:transposase [Deltaproteobacteria bacterium]